MCTTCDILRRPNRESCACRFVRAKKDPAKITHAKMALVERGLGAKRAHAKSQSVMMMMGWLCVRAGALGVCVHTCGAAHPLAPRRGTELVVARPARAGFEHSLARELNPATPGMRPRAGPGVRGVEKGIAVTIAWLGGMTGLPERETMQAARRPAMRPKVR